MISLRRLVTGCIAKTPFDKPARALWRMLRPPPPKTDWEIRTERDEADMLRLLQKSLRPDSNTVDVGANQGWFLQQFIERSAQGSHHAFEPLLHRVIELKAKFPSVTIHSCALGRKSGTASFNHVTNFDGWSGFKPQDYPFVAKVEVISVPVKRLDSFELPPISFIKIDVEGAEYEVLAGAEGIIRRDFPVILFEHARVHNVHYGTTPGEIFDLLYSYGMAIYSLKDNRRFSRGELENIYNASHASSYDRNAETNFVARRA